MRRLMAKDSSESKSLIKFKKKKEVKKPKQTNISQDRRLTEPTVTQYPSSCPFPPPSLLIWGLTVLRSCWSTQASPKGCAFPFLCPGLGEKVREKESWSHRATPFPCKSAGSEGRSRQGRAIPSCPLQLPPHELSGHETGSRHRAWWHNVPPLHPTRHGAWGAGTGGLGMPPAASAPLGLCLLEWETAPCPRGTIEVFKAETLYGN